MVGAPQPIPLLTSMTDEQVKARLLMLKNDLWSFEEILALFGTDLRNADESARLLAEFQSWADDLTGLPALMVADRLIRRNAFELFLQDRELVCIRAAAIYFGLDVAAFRSAMSAAQTKKLVSVAEAMGEFPNIYRSSLIRDFHRRFPKLRYRIFSDFNGFVESVREQIREVLEIEVTFVTCFTSQIVGINPPDVARGFDIITGEPMASHHEVWLETRKPIQLRPDSCSWATYFRYENVLQAARLGSLDDSALKYRDVIREYFQL